ncbi:hypothetical protein [Rhodopirellula bahusiensis]|uniref:hypothetical protein n=2 Tax=Rhodopirellula bahusiensis TaxID=2014065 RepID=UPI0032674FC3
MDQMKVSESQNETNQIHVAGENELLEKLTASWKPFQRQGLEVRFKMGKLLNEKLGPPKARQQHGLGTIKRISEELQIDKSDISRLRRFAAQADSLDEFCSLHPTVGSWTKVRNLLAEKNSESTPPNDAKVSAGVLRSVNSMIEAFRREDHQFSGSASDEKLVPALKELFKLAQAKLDLKLED